MPSFEIPADIFTRLSVFDSPKGSSDTVKTRKNISLYFKRRHLIIYKYFGFYQTIHPNQFVGDDVHQNVPVTNGQLESWLNSRSCKHGGPLLEVTVGSICQ